LRKVSPIFAERQHNVPRVGDIWIPKLAVSPNHFIILFIHGVEDLFQEGDRILKVEHGGSRSRLISWRLWQSQEGEWQFQQESTDEQNFTTIASNVTPLNPVAKGVQYEFTEWLE
jgi:hypothetical protein